MIVNCKRSFNITKTGERKKRFRFRKGGVSLGLDFLKEKENLEIKFTKSFPPDDKKEVLGLFENATEVS